MTYSGHDGLYYCSDYNNISICICIGSIRSCYQVSGAPGLYVLGVATCFVY